MNLNIKPDLNKSIIFLTTGKYGFLSSSFYQTEEA